MATTGAGTTDGADRERDDDVPADAPRYIEATEGNQVPTPRNGAWLVAAGLVVALTLVIALVAVTRSPADDSATPTTTTPAPGEDRDDATEEMSVAAPYDGKASMRLPITVTPNRDLVDGQTVTVSGTGFPPGADIGVLMCTNEAVFDGIAACDIGTAMSSISMTNSRITTDVNGSFSVPYTVRFHFSVADPDAAPRPTATTYVDPNGNTVMISGSSPMRQIDCGAGDIDPDVWPTVIPPTAESDPGGFTCIIAAGMVNDYDKSGGAAIGAAGAQFRTFEADERHAPPTVATATVPEPSTTTSLTGQPPTSVPPPGMVTSTYPPIDPSTTTTGPPPDQPPPSLDPSITTTTASVPVRR